MVSFGIGRVAVTAVTLCDVSIIPEQMNHSRCDCLPGSCLSSQSSFRIRDPVTLAYEQSEATTDADRISIHGQGELLTVLLCPLL